MLLRESLDCKNIMFTASGEDLRTSMSVISFREQLFSVKWGDKWHNVCMCRVDGLHSFFMSAEKLSNHSWTRDRDCVFPARPAGCVSMMFKEQMNLFYIADDVYEFEGSHRFLLTTALKTALICSEGALTH